VPVVWFLSGLTCTHENAMVKAGAQAWRPSTGWRWCFPIPRPAGRGVADDAAYDLGQGAGFYVNATEAPWAPHFRMWDYVTEELPRILFNAFPVAEEAAGHHRPFDGRAWRADHRHVAAGAVPVGVGLCADRHPTASDWGRKQFAAYLGQDESRWAPHDATLLMRKRGFDGPVLVDQGTQDQFIDLLRPEALAEAMAARRQQGTFRMQKGYDHSYFFVSTFIEDHMAFPRRGFVRLMSDWRLFIDADACPVKAEAERVATRLGARMVLVSNGGIRPSANPLVDSVYRARRAGRGRQVDRRTRGPRRCGGDGGHPAGRARGRGGRAGGQAQRRGAGRAQHRQVLATRDLMADLRAADPFRQGGGRPYSPRPTGRGSWMRWTARCGPLTGPDGPVRCDGRGAFRPPRPPEGIGTKMKFTAASSWQKYPGGGPAGAGGGSAPGAGGSGRDRVASRAGQTRGGVRGEVLT
jgi:S-formylglutathione hydrolase